MKKLRKNLCDAWDMLRVFCWLCLMAAEEPEEYEREFCVKKETR